MECTGLHGKQAAEALLLHNPKARVFISRRSQVQILAHPRVRLRLLVHAERWVGNRFSLADGTSARRLGAIPLPEHESAIPTFGRNLRQPAALGTEAFPKVLQVIRDLFLRPSDGGGDLLRRKGIFLQEGEDLTPYGFRFHRIMILR